MACYYIVISSTHLRDGQLRSIKGVFRGPIGASGRRNTEEGESSLYCELCDKQYVRHQQYDNHINSYDHHHKQRLKELKQREFYRALACRRQRRRKEEKREGRALKQLHKLNEEKRTGDCAPGSGPMFRSTTVAVEPANQTRPDFVQNWADIHSSSAAAGTKLQTHLIQPFLPLDPSLETRLLSNTQWSYGQMDTSSTTTPATKSGILNKGHNDRTATDIMNANNPCTNTSTKNSYFNKIPWAHHYFSNSISNNKDPITAANTPTDGFLFDKTTVASVSKNITETSTFSNPTVLKMSGSRAMCGAVGASEVHSFLNRVRPVSFTLPKRSCVLLHQSAAVFIQAGQGLSGKQEGVTVPERTKDPGQKFDDDEISANLDNVGEDHLDTGNQCSVDSKNVIQHSKVGASMSIERETGTQVSLGDCNVISAEERAQLSLCNDNGTGNPVGRESGTEACLYLYSDIPEQTISDRVSTVVAKNLECGVNETKTHDDMNNQTKSSPTQHPEHQLCFAPNQPEKPNTVESSIKTTSNSAKELNFPSHPKEPFCRVLNRDGSRVLLWPSEMVSYTKTSPSISYSINPLLYDFRAHNRAKEGGEGKKGGLEDKIERVKASVIKQPDSQQSHGDKTHEKEEEDGGGQAGNPMEFVDHCSISNAAPDCCSCRENRLKYVPDSTECHLAPAHGLQNNGRKRRRRRKGGVRRGMRKRGRRKRGEETKREGRKIISGLSENRIFEGGEEERFKREGKGKEESREKAPLSNLAAHRLVGGREKGMRVEERRIKADQTERERAGRNDKNRGELLSNRPMNRCNRWNKLCLQVKREAGQCQSQQSGSGWDEGIGKLLCRGTTCNSVISPVTGSVIWMPCCPAITPNPAQNDREMVEINKTTQAGTKKALSIEEQRNVRKTEISVAQDTKENMGNLVIRGVSFPRREAAHEPEMSLVPTAYGETACDPAISLVPTPFTETMFNQRQTIPVGHNNQMLGSAPCCGAQQTETQHRIRSACAEVTFSGDAISREVMSTRAVTTEKRKWESLEAGATQRKKRKRGRKQARGVASTLRTCLQGQERACVQLITDPDREEPCLQHPAKVLKVNSNKTGALWINRLSYNTTDCSTEGNRTEKTTDCPHCGTKHDQRCKINNSEETDSCNMADNLNTYCCRDGIVGSNCNTDNYSKISSDPSGGEANRKCWTEKPFSDTNTCNTPGDHRLGNERCIRDESPDDSGPCNAIAEDPCNKSDKHNPSCDKGECHSPDHMDNEKLTNDTTEASADSLLKDIFTCGTIATHADHCPSENKQTGNQNKSTDSDSSKKTDKTVFSGEAAAQSYACNITEEWNDSGCKTNDTCVCNRTNSKGGSSKEDNTKLQNAQHEDNIFESEIDHKAYRGTDRRNRGSCEGTDEFTSTRVTGCNRSTDVFGSATEALLCAHMEQRGEEKDAEMQGKEEEEKQMERKKAKEKQEQWEKDWVRRKERENEDRERRKGREFDHLYPEKRPRFTHSLPPHCIPLHAPLLFQPSVSSSSSSFSLHHTIIQHHLSFLPPPSHLPVHSYSHYLPSFSPHLSPLGLNTTPAPPPPPPPPPHSLPMSFYASSPIPLFDAPGPYPLAAAFHPLQSQHHSLFPPPHPAVLPLQMLF